MTIRGLIANILALVLLPIWLPAFFVMGWMRQIMGNEDPSEHDN